MFKSKLFTFMMFLMIGFLVLMINLWLKAFGFREIIKDSGALCMAGLIESMFELYILSIWYHI